MTPVASDISGLRRAAPFVMNPLPLDAFAAAIAPDGRRFVSNPEGIFAASPGETDFTRLCRLEELGIESRADRDHRLYHDPFGGICFSIQRGERLYRLSTGESRFRVVYEGLGGMLRGFDYHRPTGLLLAGRYSPVPPARLLSSRDGEDWSVLSEWDARHIHDVRVNPMNQWIYVIVGEGNPRVTGDSHAIYRSKDGTHFVRIFKNRRPFFLSVNFCRELVILGTDHPEGGNGIFAFADDGSDGPASPTEIFRFPEAHRGIEHSPPFARFIEWFHGSLFVGVRGAHLAYLLRTNNLVDWELVHLSTGRETRSAYVACSMQGSSPHLLISGEPGLSISLVEGAELYGLPLASGNAVTDGRP